MPENTNSYKIDEIKQTEKSNLKLLKALIYGAVCIFIAGVVIIFTWDYLSAVKEKNFEGTRTKPSSETLRELRAHETAELTTYKLINETPAVYRIPVEKAMELLVEEVHREQLKNKH